ncbi:hypothetical protein CALVIDRAFT_498241 [Calocera viscosa TUFC12733]|uniref:Wax synthase domain-containing protein n=1 Tax=Calocera viscosa (strain TUFC12733) TaxID=1330018 RepID=A0A167MQC2_CALVF|nr:hypothetical protein CALVIDRAFT_498241 [Calocera viscosa TUFC12733]
MDQIPSIASWWPFLPPEERIHITIETFPILITTGPPVLLLAYLARRPNTLLYRLAILPFAVAWCLYVVTGFRWMTPAMAPWNWALGVWVVECLVKIVDFGTDTTGFPRIGEKKPGTARSQEATHQSYNSGDAVALKHNGIMSNGRVFNGDTTSKLQATPPKAVLHPLIDALDLACAWRGIGWEHGRDTYIPPFPFPTLFGAELKKAWLQHAAWKFLRSLLLLDALEVLVKQHPNFRTPGSSSIFLASLPPLQRYPLAVMTAWATGFAVIFGFQTCYYLLGFIAVLLLGHDPRNWPPIYEAPWAATSLHDYWAKRWHQMFRRMFLVMGGWPLAWVLSILFGKVSAYVGVVVGTFLASGAYHTLSLFATGVPLGWGSMIYFSMQGVGLGLERIFRHVTGKRIHGFGGWVWVFLWAVAASTWAVDDWHIHGLGSGIVIPPILSPLRAVVFPLGRMIRDHFVT